jgi:flagellar protein FliO/FliZ
MRRVDYQIAALSLFVFCVETAFAAAPPAAAAPAISAGSVLQVVLGLVAVLGMVGAAAWLLRRFSSLRGTASGMIRVVGGAAVGQRERIVLVEIGDTWLLVGVAPGQVRNLHTMPRAQSAIGTAVRGAAPAEPGFATWLRRMSERRNHE